MFERIAVIMELKVHHDEAYIVILKKWLHYMIPAAISHAAHLVFLPLDKFLILFLSFPSV